MNQVRNLPTAHIIPGQNDRTAFDKEALLELASSIREHGLAQPITVRPALQCTECGSAHAASDAPEFCHTCGNDAWSDVYQIVAGERRFRAISQVLGWDTIPAILRELSDEEASAIMLAENVARADLDAIDEARAYHRRMETFGWSAQEIADRAGVSVVRVRFRIKLLALRPEVQKLVRDEQLPIGYAQILADADLDVNRQLIAIRHLRDNPSPTPAWFRRIVSQLLEEQAQGHLFDLPLLSGNIEAGMPAPAFIDPPHPSTTTPPKKGKSITEVLGNQVTFWNDAAEAWDRMGKPFKRQECQSAAQALQLALAVI